MNKRVVFIFLFLILSSSLTVAATMVADNEKYTITVELNKGWNLIPAILPDKGILPDSQIKSSDIKVVWYYSPIQKKYLQVYPNMDKGFANEDDDFVLTNAFWVYSNKADTLVYSTLEDYPPIGDRQLFSGWNLVSMTPDLVEGPQNPDLTLEEIKGNCNIIKEFYFFDGQWVLFNMPEMDSTLLGKGMAIKVTDNCKLGKKGISNPPQLPEQTNPINDNTLGDIAGLPNKISTYVLYKTTQADRECSTDGKICLAGYRGEYRDTSSNKIVFVVLSDIVVGDETQYLNSIKKVYVPQGGELETASIDSSILFRLEHHELFWFSGKDYPAVIFTQQGEITLDENYGYESYSYGIATVDNPVIKKLVSLHPSISIS